MLSGATSALADCPRLARRKATRESGAETLSAGQHGKSTGCRATGAIVALAAQHANASRPRNKTKKGARLGVPSP